MTFPFKKESAPDFSKQEAQQYFVQMTHSGNELLHKELDINHAEQALLKQRIEMMTGFLNDLPSIDPHYNMLLTQMQMDKIELDELKTRAGLISEEFEKKH